MCSSVQQYWLLLRGYISTSDAVFTAFLAITTMRMVAMFNDDFESELNEFIEELETDIENECYGTFLVPVNELNFN